MKSKQYFKGGNAIAVFTLSGINNQLRWPFQSCQLTNRARTISHKSSNPDDTAVQPSDEPSEPIKMQRTQMGMAMTATKTVTMATQKLTLAQPISQMMD